MPRGKASIKMNKTEACKKVVRPLLIYGKESWTIIDRNRSKIIATVMGFLKKIENITRRD